MALQKYNYIYRNNKGIKTYFTSVPTIILKKVKGKIEKLLSSIFCKSRTPNTFMQKLEKSDILVFKCMTELYNIK